MKCELEQHGQLDCTVTTVWDRGYEPDWWRVAAYMVGVRNAATYLARNIDLDDELTLLVHIASRYAVQQTVHKTLPAPHTDNTRAS